MIKGNYGESYQQSINELFATELHRKQKFENFTVYTPTLLTVEGGIEGLGCLSYDFFAQKIWNVSVHGNYCNQSSLSKMNHIIIH